MSNELHQLHPATILVELLRRLGGMAYLRLRPTMMPGEARRLDLAGDRPWRSFTKSSVASRYPPG